MLPLEFSDVLADGLVTAAMLLLVLFWHGVVLPLVALTTAAAQLLGVPVHQMVLVRDALLSRARV